MHQQQELSAVPRDVAGFLLVPTPDAWVEAAIDELPVLLLDHANCEMKAAATALSLMHRYGEHRTLSTALSRLARTELRHFEQVVGHLERLGIAHQRITAAAYASSLREEVRPDEPGRLVDLLIVSAFIEARSTERLALLATRVVDPDLSDFFSRLVATEASHFHTYIDLAQHFSPEIIDDRLAHFAVIERELVLRPSELIRFHSGPPA